MRVYFNIAHGKTVLWRFKQGAQAYYVKFYIVNNAIYATLHEAKSKRLFLWLPK